MIDYGVLVALGFKMVIFCVNVRSNKYYSVNLSSAELFSIEFLKRDGWMRYTTFGIIL